MHGSSSRGPYEDSEWFFEMVLSQIEDYVCIWNRDKQCIYANDKLERLWGIKREYMWKTPSQMRFSPDGIRLFEGQIEHVVETGEAATSNFPFGASRQYDCVFSPVFDAEGRVEFVACVTRDITERTKMEEALRESERQYELLFQSLEEAFCLLRVIYDESGEPRDFIILKVNPAFEKHTGISEVVGKRPQDIVPDLEDKWPEAWKRVAKTGASECFVEESQAMGRWYDTCIYSLEGAQSGRIALLFYDITPFMY